ncbi:hypothetical protein ACT7DH_13445 [Bacillus pacificus]
MLTIISMLEAFSIIAQTVFLARAITFLFQGEVVQSVLNETVYFGITFAVRHLLVQMSQILVERFAEKNRIATEKTINRGVFHIRSTVCSNCWNRSSGYLIDRGY